MRLNMRFGKSDSGSGSLDTRITAQLVPVQEGAIVALRLARKY
jgi:hypothetical protein